MNRFEPICKKGFRAMPQPTLEQRIAALEKDVARLSESQRREGPRPEKNWRSTLGMFADDAIMKEVIDEGRKIRQFDREQTSQ
jgi:hypothetical protein